MPISTLHSQILKHGSVFSLLAGLLVTGCSSETAPPVTTGGSDTPVETVVAQETAETPAEPQQQREFKPLAFHTGSAAASGGSGQQPGAALTTDQKVESVIDKLKPIQILLGQWRGTTRREFGEFKAVDAHEWIWDLQSQPDQPALVIASDNSPYLQTGRLTWDLEQQEFLLEGEDLDGNARTFRGNFTEEPHEVLGDDDKPQKVFRLELTQTQPDDSGEQWQLAIAQQENNRYLLQVDRRRGNASFARHDTVSTQRDGTSFALNDTDYAERTCIISEGLGTTELKWKGRSYWVCCSGCKAAFEEDPATWIARAAERQDKKSR
ncbi:MAG: hypothetical protein ACO3FE_17360 [Planctomycetaceae bacterium]|jgi:hypothetical protein